MPLFKRGQSKRLVLDLGTSAIRICELSQTKAGFQLTKYYQRELNTDPALDEDEKTENRKEVLEALLKEAKIRTKKTVIAVPGQSVFTRNRPLPPVPEFKVTQIVKYEIQQQIPFSLDEIALDYQVLDRTEVGGYDVMMAAIKVDVVDKHVSILKQVKRTIDTVDVSPLAAYNWLRHTGEFGDDGQCVALIDMGATTTDIVIQKDNQFKFTRSLHTGGNDITAAISSGFGMSWEDAEKLKREKGFAPTGDPKRDGKGGETIGRITGRLVSEINRSFSYFRSQPGGSAVNKVIVTGGGACLRNIIPYLQRQLNVEVRIAQPLAGLAISPNANEASEFPEQSCVALGLALRCSQEVPIQINLIPPRVQVIAKQKEQALYWVLTLLTIYLIMASTIPKTAKEDEEVQARIKRLKLVLGAYDATLISNPSANSDYEDLFDFTKRDVEGYKKQVEELDSLKRYRLFWLDEMQAINDSLPRNRTGLALSSIQAAVIGGEGNTGDAGREALKKYLEKQARGPVEEEEKPKAEPEAEPKPGGILGGQFGINPNAAGPKTDVYTYAGYPGNGDPNTGAGSVQVRTGPGAPKPAAGAAPSKGIVEPNGLIMFGYAWNLDFITEFMTKLQDHDVFLKEGVYFHVTLADPDIDDTELDAADPGNIGSSGSSGGPSAGGAIKIGAVPSAAKKSTSSNILRGGWGVKIVKFRIDVQFNGVPIAKPEGQTQFQPG
jgi:type IV pilus assembly protein PilM